MMVTRIGIKGLIEQGIKPKKIHSKDNWMAVVKAVSQGEKPYGFVYKDFYDGLNKLSQGMVTKLGETSEQSIFHSVFIKSEHVDKAQTVTDILLEAHKKVKGNETLKAVNVEKFTVVTKEEVLNFKSLLELESEIME